jgi:hypothetical protein
MRRFKREVRFGLIGSVAVVTGLVGVMTFATAAGAKKTTTTTTTTTTVPPTTTTTPSTVPCTPAPATATAGSATMTVTPGTCLNGGSVVAVSGSGFDPSSTGIVLQCNGAPASDQPVVALTIIGNSETLPVSCTPLVFTHAVTTTATGDIPAGTSYTVIGGKTPGPPCGPGSLAPSCPPDTGGTATGNAVADAANYPCPPTPAQIAAGITCNISFGDEGGAAVTVPITYVQDVVPGGDTTTTTAPATAASTAGSTAAGATPAAAAPKTAASSGSLAFTGPGTGLYIIGAAGFIMVLLGAAILGLSGAPSSLALALRRRRRSS